jgi:Na+-translocating ferredoxin:NAD+ oxidoreductase RNF subunit RnfB
MGAAFGLLLAFASKVFAVEVDPRQEEIMEVLPGANCGGCGFAGCSAYATAVVAGEAPCNKCAPGGADVAAKVGAIMGEEVGGTEKNVALVRCSAHTGMSKKKFEYSGLIDCVAAMRLGGGQGPNECPSGCIGFGTCVKACPFDAIHIEDGIAVVDHEKCVGCQTCVAACPKKIIMMVPYEANVTVPCASTQKGAVTRKVCNIGCIGCKMCEKACEHDAIHVNDNLAFIDYSKCVGCGKCAEKCPRKLIVDTAVKTASGEEVQVPVVTAKAE